MTWNSKILLFFIGLLVIICIIFASLKCTSHFEPFSPTGLPAQYPPLIPTLRVPSLYHYFQKKFNGAYYTGSCGPGCVYQCKNPNCPNSRKGQYSVFPQQIKDPKALPVGANANMSLFFDVDQCASSGVNGSWHTSHKNPYGLEFPLGNQTYSYCDKSTSNRLKTN